MANAPLKFLFIAVLASVCVAGAKAQSPTPSPSPRQYTDPFDPWRACTKALSSAAKGNPVALHTIFLAAYVRMSDPYLGGEDLESMVNCMEKLLKKRGDTAFAESLTLERPEVRAAVGRFLQPAQLRGAPKTQQLIAKAPKIDFNDAFRHAVAIFEEELPIEHSRRRRE